MSIEREEFYNWKEDFNGVRLGGMQDMAIDAWMARAEVAHKREAELLAALKKLSYEYGFLLRNGDADGQEITEIAVHELIAKIEGGA